MDQIARWKLQLPCACRNDRSRDGSVWHDVGRNRVRTGERSCAAIASSISAEGGFDYRSMAYLGAYGFGNGLLFAIGLVIPFLTFVNGTCLIYLQTVSGVDFSATEEQLSQHVADAKRHAEQARERAADHLAKARDSHAASAAGTASLPASDTASPAADAATACAQCHKPMAADDLFCGECGARRHA
ncbi:hypothetical protein [Burkholderia lata]|uniref:hypothetical protein n=1 Tax=Burkholderia lata (strain ATCC 17760 / DSM 23089 / LMG 22485 / NCIMB 9086 / R18194 / 383) TaxID=482957 RepID=UPI001582033C|nr:hypothetical protein [Burkholderia lata]